MGISSRKPSTVARRKARREREWARAYGSRERVEFVQAMGCLVCGWKTQRPRPGGTHTIENAHTVTGGAGRKADASTIINLCWRCHDAYDNAKQTFPATHGFDPAEEAARVERMWRDWGEND